MRTFVAVKIDVNRELKEFINELQLLLQDERIKWVNTDNFHLTLFFLGETAESQINPIASVLRKIVEDYTRINLVLKGLGVFKNIRDPRVIWIGLSQNSVLQELHSRVQGSLVGQGYRKDDRPFRPHLTIGRPKRIYDQNRLSEVVEKNKNRYFQEVIIEEIVFYQSILKQQGPEYCKIDKFNLKPLIPD